MKAWKESPNIRKARVAGQRRMGTLVERTLKEEVRSSRGDWRDLLEESMYAWEDDEQDDDLDCEQDQTGEGKST